MLYQVTYFISLSALKGGHIYKLENILLSDLSEGHMKQMWSPGNYHKNSCQQHVTFSKDKCCFIFVLESCQKTSQDLGEECGLINNFADITSDCRNEKWEHV
jgi:hypothetical protein